MKHEFWHQRWIDGQIGFHLDTPNPALTRWWPSFGVPEGSRVLVPLCGKSNDVAWLADAGLRVVGVELSEVACTAFFRERGWVPAVDRHGLFRRYRHGGVTILQGDFLQLAPDEPFPAAYDRASMIALPPDMREAYSARLIALTMRGSQVLLVTMDYPEGERAGPPFNVSAAEIAGAYGDAFTIEHLEQRDLRVAEPERWGKLSRAVEDCWRLVRR